MFPGVIQRVHRQIARRGRDRFRPLCNHTERLGRGGVLQVAEIVLSLATLLDSRSDGFGERVSLDIASRLTALEDCADVIAGLSVAGRLEHDPAGTHQVVTTRHLTEGVPYEYEAAHRLRIVPGRATESYELHEGDVLFMSRGTRNRAWAVASVPNPTIAPVSFYILRPSDGLDGGYFAWYLNQAPAQ